MEWLANLSNAIEYIEKNLDQELSYDEAARIACCSTYYFQRIFSYAAGVPLSEYIRRRRMTQAAFELRASDRKVLEIALKYGYTSPTAFNRAFKSVHGISPTAARNEGCTLNAYPPLRFTVEVAGDTPLPYRIEEKGPLRIVGARLPLTEDWEHNRAIVPPFWQRNLDEGRLPSVHRLSNLPPQGLLGLSVYRNPQEIFYYIGVSTDATVPEGMHEERIPSASWVVFEDNGPYRQTVQNIFRRFATEWLPASGYIYAELPDIEVYPYREESQNFPNIRNRPVQVWIGVKAAGEGRPRPTQDS